MATKPKWTNLTTREIEILRILVHQKREDSGDNSLDELFNKLTKILDEIEDMDNGSN